ncbi:hypothetical protein SSX86_008434 [Deinandra increscens subsp. villosa]|uniref:F-box domain-containing protein n=1 Tax=Deinandra increscens subsp. villosa TaxID=3103831 RepID=A0AAP0DG41_9ASTR
MDKLPGSLLLHILSRLDDSADVARCRVAWKAFDAVYPGLRSINLRWSLKWYYSSRSRVSDSQRIKHFQTVFLDLISKLETVESVSIGVEKPLSYSLLYESDSHLTDGDSAKEWLSRVSGSLKSLSISDRFGHRPTNIFPLISVYCHSLVKLKLEFVWLNMHNMNPMPMLTNLPLRFTHLKDEDLNELNKCFPNLQNLSLVGVRGLRDPKIHLLNLKTCFFMVNNECPTLTLITPSLIKLLIECITPAALHVEAPMLSRFYLGLNPLKLTVKRFENLKTLLLDSYIGSLLSQFPITKTVQRLILNSDYLVTGDAKLTLGKVFTVFPNVRYLCIKSGAWSELEACLNVNGQEILDGRKGLKIICAYLKLVDPSLTFSSVACVLDQCLSLSKVSLLIHTDVEDTVSNGFMSKCMTRWPGLKWRWGTWSEEVKDSWIINGASN